MLTANLPDVHVDFGGEKNLFFLEELIKFFIRRVLKIVFCFFG